MVLFSLGVYAVPTPLPIAGKVIGDHVSNLPVEVKNMRTLVAKTTYTSDSGEYNVGATELQGNGYYLYGGDVFRISILSCVSNPKCVQEITYEGQDELFLIFDLTGEDTGVIPVEPEPEVVEPESSVTASADTSIATTNAFYGQDIEIKLDDNKIGYLIDGEISVDGETYEVSEEVYFAGTVKTSIDDDDFGKNPYLVFESYGAEYQYIFNDHIIIEDISEDNPADIKFLGKDLKIIEASANEITVRYGSKITLLQGKSDTVDGNKVEIIAMTNDDVSLKINGVSGSVTKGDTATINGLEVVIDSLLYQAYADGVKTVTLIIGEKVQATYKDGDYFDLFIEDDEVWEWIIQLGGTEQYLGVWNVEDYLGIDEDDDYHALGIGDSFFLPNDYVEIQFKSVTNPDITDLNIRVKDGYLYLRGNTDDDVFSFGTKDYDRVYMDAAGIYDEDFNTITTDKVEIGDSGIYLEKGSAKIGDLTIELDLSDILFKGISFALKDETFMDYLGIIFTDPEDAIDEKRGFEVLVPEDRPEVTIAFGKDIPVEAVDDVIECKTTTCKNCTLTCPEEKECVPVTKTVYVDKECPEEKTCPTPEGDNLGTVIISVIASLVIGGAGGIYFTRNKVMGTRGGLKIYRNNNGEDVTQHRHPGILGYHDPIVSHREDHERHPKGQLFPHYEKDDDGVYIYKN